MKQGWEYKRLGEIWKSRFPNLTWMHIYKPLSPQSSRTNDITKIGTKTI